MAKNDPQQQQSPTDQQPSKAMVKVKFLRQVGPHAAGDEAEVESELAEQLCQPSMQQHGGHLKNLQKAVKLDEYEKLKADKNVDITGMTQVEMDALGLVNRIPSPYDTHPAHEAVDIGEKADKIKAEHAKKK